MRNPFFNVLAMALLMVPAACDRPPPAPGGGPGEGAYRHALDGAPDSLDPVHAASQYANFVVVNLYDTLYAYRYLARPYVLEPNLAAALPEISADGLVYRISLKQGVLFQDDPAFAGGDRELTADDVVYSLSRHFEPAARSRGAWLWHNRIVGLDAWGAEGGDADAEIEGLRAIDRYTVEIRLLRPYPQLVNTLATGFSAIIPRRAVEYYGADFALHPVGSGPYRLAHFDLTRAVLERNPEFRSEPFAPAAEGYDPALHDPAIAALAGRPPPFTDRIELEFILEDSARWQALRSGELDYARVPAVHFAEVLEAPGAPGEPLVLKARWRDAYRVRAQAEAGFARLDFNMDDPRIGDHDDPHIARQNRELRCAIRQAFDWPARNEALYFNIGQVYPGVIPPFLPEYDPALDDTSIRRDLDAARSVIMARHDFPDLEYGYASSVVNRQFFEQFRAFMEEAGYLRQRIKAQVFPGFADFLRAVRERQVMLIFSGWNMDFPDAENIMQLYYGPNSAPGANYANYRNPEYDQLYEAAAVLPPGGERTALYRRMNRMLIDDCVTVSGISRTFVLMWGRQYVMWPDVSFVGGHFLRYVARRPAGP